MGLRRNMAWVGASQAAFFLFQFAGSVVVARLLTPYEMGVYAVALAIVGVLGTIQAFGLTGFVVREAVLDNELMASVQAANTMLCIFLAALIGGVSFFSGRLLHEDGVRRVMLYLTLLPLLDILQFGPSAKLERHADFKSLAFVGGGRTAISQVITIAGALLHYSYFSMAYGQIAASAFSVVAYNIIGSQHRSLRHSTKHLRRVASFGVQMLAISGVNSIALRLSEALLGRIVGLAALGLYSRASNLNNLVWENIHLVIGRVVFVDLSEQNRQNVPLRPVYLRIVAMMTALLWPMFIGLAVVSGPFILAVYGQRWVAAAQPLAVLAIAACLLVSISMTWELFVIKQQTSVQARVEVLRATFGLLVFVGCSFIGLVAAAAARILDAAFSIALYRPHLNRMTETTAQDFIPIYLTSASLTALSVGPAAGYMACNGFSARASLIGLLFSILVGVILWATALFMFNHPLAQEARYVLARRKRGINVQPSRG